MALTKSLHTITAVTKVAAYLAANGNRSSALDLTAAALAVLGYPMTRSALHLAAMSDPTLNKCIESVAKVTGRSQSDHPHRAALVEQCGGLSHSRVQS